MQSLSCCHNVVALSTDRQLSVTRTRLHGRPSHNAHYRVQTAFGSGLGCRSVRQQLKPTCAARSEAAPHLQLATAKIPSSVDIEGFKSSMYQWAATLTSSGKNMPFALPIQADKIEEGFQMSLLRIREGSPVSVGDIAATVEQEPNVGNVLFVRFYEGPGSGMDRQGPPLKDEQQRLKLAAENLVDLPILMGTMFQAIRQSVAQNMKKPSDGK